MGSFDVGSGGSPRGYAEEVPHSVPDTSRAICPAVWWGREWTCLLKKVVLRAEDCAPSDVHPHPERPMLGPAKSRRLDEPIAVSLEALVPQGHVYRHLESKLDLGFVRGWVDDHYADRGRPSIDPVVFFKLQEEPGTELGHAPSVSSRGTALWSHTRVLV
jgi:hypothetical protein